MVTKPTSFEVPPELRELAEKSVDQARKAFGEFVNAAEKAVNAVDHQAQSAKFGAGDVNRQALAYMEQNVESTLNLASRLVQARTLEEVAALQQEFFRDQAKAAAEQASGLTQTLATAARGGKPDKP